MKRNPYKIPPVTSYSESKIMDYSTSKTLCPVCGKPCIQYAYEGNKVFVHKLRIVGITRELIEYCKEVI